MRFAALTASYGVGGGIGVASALTVARSNEPTNEFVRCGELKANRIVAMPP